MATSPVVTALRVFTYPLGSHSRKVLLTGCSLLLTTLLVSHNSTAQQPIKPSPGSPCAGKTRIRGFGIPRDAPKQITQSVRARGVIICLGAGVCHIKLLSGQELDLNPPQNPRGVGDTMNVGDKDDTMIFTCANGAPQCGVTVCD
jgi:hypothetical protein